MGEGNVRVARGTVVRVNIRNIGWVEGTVAWVQDNRFGVAFRDDIDPRLAREPIARTPESSLDYYMRISTPEPTTDKSALRKI